MVRRESEKSFNWQKKFSSYMELFFKYFNVWETKCTIYYTDLYITIFISNKVTEILLNKGIIFLSAYMFITYVMYDILYISVQYIFKHIYKYIHIQAIYEIVNEFWSLETRPRR